MGTTPSEEALKIAWMPSRTVSEADKQALSIDALVARRVEEERERCCRAVTKLYNNINDGANPHDQIVHRCELAIRTTPTKG